MGAVMTTLLSNTLKGRRAATLMCLLACIVGGVQADEYIIGGDPVDIDYTIEGFLWVEDATANLYEGAWIKDIDSSPGYLWAASGATVNIYGGKIDSLVIITSDEGSMLPDPTVTVYGTDFAVNGVPVEPGTPELFLQNETLSGVYDNGTEFAFNVEGFWVGSYYLTIKLGWLTSAPEISVEPEAVEFDQVEIGTEQSAIVSITNKGNANLTLQSLAIVQDDGAGFGFIPLEQLPTTVEPNSVVELEVVFAPSAEGSAAAVLQIGSDDPNKPLVEVMLSGAGYTPVLTPREQIASIIDCYLAGLRDDTIVGIGWGRTAKAKEIAMGHMLVCAKNLINSGYEKWALVPMMAIDGHTDGNAWPADLVKGPETPVMNAMVKDLISDIKEDCSTMTMHCKKFRFAQSHRFKR